MLFSGLQPVPPAMYAASRAAERPATARQSDDAPPSTARQSTARPSTAGTKRPSTGATALRPTTGATKRPSTSGTRRPSTGATKRPSTGATAVRPSTALSERAAEEVPSWRAAVDAARARTPGPPGTAAIREEDAALVLGAAAAYARLALDDETAARIEAMAEKPAAPTTKQNHLVLRTPSPRPPTGRPRTARESPRTARSDASPRTAEKTPRTAEKTPRTAVATRGPARTRGSGQKFAPRALASGDCDDLAVSAGAPPTAQKPLAASSDPRRPPLKLRGDETPVVPPSRRSRPPAMAPGVALEILGDRCVVDLDEHLTSHGGLRAIDALRRAGNEKRIGSQKHRGIHSGVDPGVGRGSIHSPPVTDFFDGRFASDEFAAILRSVGRHLPDASVRLVVASLASEGDGTHVTIRELSNAIKRARRKPRLLRCLDDGTVRDAAFVVGAYAASYQPPKRRRAASPRAAAPAESSDGRLSRADLLSKLRALARFMQKRRWRVLDLVRQTKGLTHADGWLGLNEFQFLLVQASLQARVELPKRSFVVEAFRAMDAAGHGAIEVTEIDRWLAEARKAAHRVEIDVQSRLRADDDEAFDPFSRQHSNYVQDHKAVAAHVLPAVLRRRQQNATIAKATDPKLRVDAEFDDDPLLPHHRRSDWREAFFHAMKPAAPAPPPTKVASTARTTTDEDDAGGEEA